MAKSCPPPFTRGFTLIELLVVIASITILAALVVPAFTRAFESAKATKDTSNLRQIGAATQMYMNDNNSVFPGSATLTWMSQLEQNQKYLSSWRVLESPFDKRTTSELGGAAAAGQTGLRHNARFSELLPPETGGRPTRRGPARPRTSADRLVPVPVASAELAVCQQVKRAGETWNPTERCGSCGMIAPSRSAWKTGSSRTPGASAARASPDHLMVVDVETDMHRAILLHS